MNTIVCNSPIGDIWVSAENGKITSLSFEEHETDEYVSEPVLEKAVKQLSEYFSGKRKVFDLELELRGTDFQKAVWNELLKIPFGETRSYGEIAAAIGKPKASRAVGMGCNRNPVAIIVPCHRVIGKDGSLTGFGAGIGTKVKLLEHEGAKFLCETAASE